MFSRRRLRFLAIVNVIRAVQLSC